MNDYFWVASVYGDGAYSANTYSCSSGDLTCVAAQQATQLADTGMPIIGLATLACLLIFTGLVIRFWRQKRTS